MKKQFFAWKDGTNELSEITAKEFIAICEQNKTLPKTKRRYFARVPGVTQEDTYYFIECGYEEYKKTAAEGQARYRRISRERTLRANGLWRDVLSMDQPFEDGVCNGGSFHDVIADPSAAFEEALVTSIALEEALSHLTDSERETLRALYFDNDSRASEREIAARLGIPVRTLNRRKHKILWKLKKDLA